MANIIRIKRKTTTGLPTIGSLQTGEGVLNLVDNTLCYKKDTSTLLVFKVAADVASEIFANAALTGTPTAPTAAANNNTTQVATTAFVMAALAGVGNGDMLKSIYDSTNNGKVDLAENSENLGGVAASSYATQTFVSNAINALVASAPGVLDTLNELAAALGNDPNFASTITSALATKLDANSEIDGGSIA